MSLVGFLPVHLQGFYEKKNKRDKKFILGITSTF